ncbi:aspartyl/asparaginyl beta-hydroxylase domain-containing protein [Sphingomonas sp. 1P06PA]|uniref:aspartyl/asparaginyl beta-hydroxylase domain-containing protein n=1 Tax=Sphingomonas sp. 1P06PA TaxID=554121 RepID=UPI0039A69B28
MTDQGVVRLLETAMQAQREGRAAQAEVLLLRALEAGPDEPVVLNSLGVHWLAEGRARDAQPLFERAVSIDTQAPPLWMNLAKACRLQGDDAGERRALDAVLAIDQRDLMALVRMAELHERRGEPALAAQRWAGVIAVGQQISPRNADLQKLLDHASAFVADRMAAFGSVIDDWRWPAVADADPLVRRRFNAAMDAVLGRRRIFANQCVGLHYPFLPADEFFDRSHFPWMAGLEAQTPALRAEAEHALTGGLKGFEPYIAMERGLPENLWSGLDHSMDWSALHLWRYGERNHALCDRFPAITAAIEALPLAQMPRRAPTVFLSVLRPGARIPPHTGVSNARTIIHLPLIVPDGCSFRVGGETRPWRVGEAFAFDDTIEHEAINPTDQPRVVLIFDVWNPHLTQAERELLIGYFDTADASGHNPGLAAAVSDD